MMVDADVTERRRAEEERAHLLRRLITAHEEERGRLSREMHDQFGQHLSVLALKIAALKRDCVEHEALREQVELLEALANQLDSDIEFLVWNLRPTALDDLGLVVASSNLAARWAEHVGIKPDLHTRGMDKERLAGEIETMLYRVLQEALTNVAKHATAENVSILLERRGGTVSLLVEDDGIGFDAERVFGTAGKGLGLIGMRERAALVGGKVEIESHPGSGTTIAVRVPVRGGAEADTTFRVQRDDRGV
jgi:signal transduction histidine kinase